MQLKDIQQLNEIDILQKDIFIKLLAIENEVTKEELESALLDRAKELGIRIAFNKRLSAYKKEQKKPHSVNRIKIIPNIAFILKEMKKGMSLIAQTIIYLSLEMILSIKGNLL